METNSNTSCVDVAGFDQIFNQDESELLTDVNQRNTSRKQKRATESDHEFLGEDNNFDQFLTPSKG